MWEQIRANKRKSVVLVFSMALVLMALGAVIGAFISPSGGGAIMGIMLAGIVWLIMTMIAYSSGGKILMAASKAKKIEKKDHPQLYNVVEEMTIAAGLAKMPDIYIIDDMSMNAFAAGRDPDHAVVAVTAGLLGRLNRDELQGVIAHEMSHIQNRDVLFMTMLGIMLGAIVIIAEVFLRGMFYSSLGRRRSRNSSSKDGNQAQVIIMVVAILFAILAPILAQIIYFASSRRREYLADAGAALLTRYPEGLASALESISRDSRPMASVSKATAPMYISNPLAKRSAAGLTSTHPPIKERVRILRSMGGSASYDAYQRAWEKIGGAAAGALPASALKSSGEVKAREAHPDARKKKDTRRQLRQATDVLRKANRFVFLSCVCGLKLKLPPEFKSDHVACPRCSRDIAVPVAQMAVMERVADAIDKHAGKGGSSGGMGSLGMGSGNKPLVAVRNRPGPMKFKCTCGHTMKIPASFSRIDCPVCGAEIRIRDA